MSTSDHIYSINFFSAIIDHISNMTIGVEQIVGIYSGSNRSNDLYGICLEYRNNRVQERELFISGEHLQLRKMQQEHFSFKWLDRSQTPFDSNTISNSQLNIFNEYEHLILLISIPHKRDIEKDLIFIYFKNDVDQFGVQHQKTPLSTQNKSIIGHLISSSAISYAKMYWEHEDKHRRFAEKTNQIIESQKADNKDSIRKNELEEMIISWAHGYLLDCSKADRVNYVYNEGAIEKIKSFKGEFSILKNSIGEAIEYVKLLDTNVNKIIKAEYLIFITDVNNMMDGFEMQQLSPRLQKATDFLNKLEIVTLKIVKNGQNLTSYNVGKEMDRPISPAAISDYLSKNRDRINTLIKQYPDNWNFIKSNFRPIINIINKNNTNIKNWA